MINTFCKGMWSIVLLGITSAAIVEAIKSFDHKNYYNKVSLTSASVLMFIAFLISVFFLFSSNNSKKTGWSSAAVSSLGLAAFTGTECIFFCANASKGGLLYYIAAFFLAGTALIALSGSVLLFHKAFTKEEQNNNNYLRLQSNQNNFINTDCCADFIARMIR